MPPAPPPPVSDPTGADVVVGGVGPDRAPRRWLPGLAGIVGIAVVAWLLGLGRAGVVSPDEPSAAPTLAEAPQTPWATTVELVQALNEGDIDRAAGVVGVGAEWFELPGMVPLIDATPAEVRRSIKSFVDMSGYLALGSCVWEPGAAGTVVCDLEFTSGFSRAIEVTPLSAELSIEFADGAIRTVRSAPTLAGVLSVLPQEAVRRGGGSPRR